MFKKTAAVLAASASLAAGACEKPSADTIEYKSPAPQVSSWIGRCGTNTLVLNDPTSSEKGGYTRACYTAEETREAIGAGALVTIAKGNGWFIDSERSGCITAPIVTEIDGQGYFASAVPTTEGPEVTLFDLPGGLPEGLQTQSVTLTTQDGRYVASVNGQPQAVAMLLQQGDCK